MSIDIDAVKKFCDENPMHLSPREELEAVFEYFECLGEDDPCLPEARCLLDAWDLGNTSLEMQRAQADFFFMKWHFVDGNGQPWRPAGAGKQQ
jgi:hypothetical protein